MTLPQEYPRPDDAGADALGLNDPALYLNRELSLLEFNQRVLEQARDTSQPLLERLRFLTICSTNLDEFFEIRAAGVKEQIAYGVSRADADGLSPQAAMKLISERAHQLVGEQYRFLNEILLPELEAEGIRILRRTELNKAQRTWVEKYFKRE
ncbi:MAG: RNA degradosome polyphosphate kinase, partial [Planctomycetes bacterium]|nr:RNA degradosome polyphosphate kinase [Planctomycetota bacterium]